MYSNPTAGSSAFTDLVKGFKVSRATSDLPQTDTTSYFAVTGGRVLVTRIIGEVTTAIQNSDPVLSLTSTPTTGSAVVLASTVDASSLEVGGFLSAECDGTALVKSNAGGILNTAVPTGAIVPIGNIQLIAGASKTGKVQWDLWYFPLDEGASVAAV